MQSTHRLQLASLAVVFASVLAPAAAYAQPILQSRCASDTADIATAIARLEWARKCGTTVNVQSPNNPTLAFDTGLQASTPAGAELFDYNETLDLFGKNAFTSIGNQTQVNDSYVRNQFKPGRITMTLDPLGFQKWTEPVLLGRPNYPTFGNNADISQATQLFPPPPISGSNPPVYPNDCRLFLDSGGHTVANTTTTGFFVNGYCTASCYTPEQEVRFATGNEKILDAMNALRNDVTTLTPGSSLQKIKLKTDNVASYTRDLHDAKQLIFTIRTASGGELRVTDRHPVILAQGRVVEARSLKVGDQLIKANGTHDRIVSVTKTNHFGKVYNLKPKSTNRVANILIAQGYLVGSSRYQNEDVDYINRIILGRSIPAHVIPH